VKCPENGENDGHFVLVVDNLKEIMMSILIGKYEVFSSKKRSPFTLQHQLLFFSFIIMSMVGHTTWAMDYKFEKFQSILTYGANSWEFFTIDNMHYLAVANGRNNSNNEVHSIIYQWNGSEFIEFQSIPTQEATTWEFFTINDENFLALGNGASNSELFHWNDSKFILFQSFPKMGQVGDWEFFSINNKYYLAAAVYKINNVHNTTSKVYEWSGSKFVEFQSFTTYGAFDWEFFSIDNKHYLALANSLNHHTGTTLINSKIYQWNNNKFTDFQTIETDSATDWKYFSIDQNHYLSLTTGRAWHDYPNSIASPVDYETDSKIYQWNGNTFVEIQSISTNKDRDWEYFTINNKHYLVTANTSNSSTTNLNSIIYEWNGSKFAEFQSISTHAARDWEHFVIDEHHYLVVANNRQAFDYKSNTNVNSTIYKWSNFNSIKCEGHAHYDAIKGILNLPMIDMATVTIIGGYGRGISNVIGTVKAELAIIPKTNLFEIKYVDIVTPADPDTLAIAPCHAEYLIDTEYLTIPKVDIDVTTVINDAPVTVGTQTAACQLEMLQGSDLFKIKTCEIIE